MRAGVRSTSGDAPAHFSGTPRFRLDSMLGRGATGVVYAAFDLEQATQVALKLLTHWSPEGIAAFKNEFRALQGVRHENLVELRELLLDEGHWFLTMELVRGLDLLAYVRGSNLGDPHSSRVRAVEAGPGDETLQPWISAAIAPSTPLGSERSFDEGRLRPAFLQLALGLSALHAANKIHRDVKPSNVLVDGLGRVVVVDFGLVIDADALRLLAERRPLGTPRYMAPEQASLGAASPASDWFSVGVLLYEALTGRSPFAGLRADTRPAAPHTLCPDAPGDLSELCLSLLAHEPARRPSGAEIVARLHQQRFARAPEVSPIGVGAEGKFVGRTHELGALDECLQRVDGGRSTTVVIEGESGVGKTSLIQRFIEQVRSERAVHCFSGRCFERESLPYKAIDGVMDAVCEELSRRSPSDLSRLLPPTAALIGQAFPVLRQLVGFAAPVASQERVDPHLERLRVFSALRELFVRIAEERFTIVVLDDMQWSDGDSLALLSALLEPPGAPRLLLILAKRPGGPLANEQLSGPVVQLSLGNLSHQEADELLSNLLRSMPRGEAFERARALAREASGHPLFLRELAQQFATQGSEAQTVLRLDEALWRRVAALAGPPLGRADRGGRTADDAEHACRGGCAVRAPRLLPRGHFTGTPER